MKSNYQISDWGKFGFPIPMIWINGDKFHYQDLYELVGRDQFTVTFETKDNSKSNNEFGKEITGIINYSRNELEALKKATSSGEEINKHNVKIRINPICQHIDLQKKGDLKYQGLDVADIECIHFLRYKQAVKKYETGEKKIPDILEVDVDLSGIDQDQLAYNLIAKYLNSEIKLIQHEKEKFIGLHLAFNDGRIDSRLLAYLGFNQDELENNLNIRHHMYKVKESRNTLNEIEAKNHQEIKKHLSLSNILKVVDELKKNGTSVSDISEYEKNIIGEIIKSVESFFPSVLLRRTKQTKLIYWNIDSYIHIALRHIKEYQTGNYKEKASFSYKAEELKILIERVLTSIEDEITDHFSQESFNEFSRHGKMAVFYNDDYYHLRINTEGRIVQFHPV
ncbi:MAG: hypothetical protein D3917_07845 [Candidatus Electrothrix sp. AX5]|nr:hypothetical protein [Candidatus Electrothrix sp. AX5]